MDWIITPEVATIIAAFAAAFVGSISLVITKEQKVSEFRQAWINSLRDDLSEAISSASTLTLILQDIEKQSDHFLPEWSRLTTTLSRIELRLNPKETPHQKLIACIRSAEDLMRRLESDRRDYKPKEWEKLQSLIVEVSQNLLKIEWDRVRDGEPFYKFFKAILIAGVVLVITVALFSIWCDWLSEYPTHKPTSSITRTPPER